jgi:hypothetical protein
MLKSAPEAEAEMSPTICSLRAVLINFQILIQLAIRALAA